ncbi:MAG TPA: DNA repair protein RecO [Burkholderiaceae bacterium]|jgi:DNA repair protein RecO (recombination protein O)|nr:DNA repair protein RecO [Burkholderiaceae bacterium]
MNDLAASGRPRVRRAHEHRVDQQPALVLHSYPWRETSLIVEVFTRDHGRMALVARGAKRPTSQFRGLLTPFSPLLVAWSGRNEIKSLVRVEWCGGLPPLRGAALFAGFYLNELLVRLLARADPHELLFARYVETLGALARGDRDQEAALRGFELELLRETGHAPAFDHCADGAAIDVAATYRVDAQRGLVRAEPPFDDDPALLSGRSALAIARGDLSSPEVAADCKRVLRHLIRYHLNGQPLNTRRILHDLHRL